jgi:hypothetical protein
MKKKADMEISSRAFLGLKQGSVLPILAAVLFFVAFAGANAMAHRRGQYGDRVSFDAHQIPLSRFGSYLAFQHGHGSAHIVPPVDALFLRTVHRAVPERELFRIELVRGDTVIPFEEQATK